jgi:cytochrome c oxidase subunit 2
MALTRGGLHIARGACAALAFSLLSGLAQAEMKLNLQEPITQLGREVYDLHLLMTIVCGVIFVAVFGVMFWSVFVHRKSAGYKAATFHESTTVEILWTIVPVFILLGMAWPATKTILAMRDTSNADITIKATGYQWKWGLRLPQG